MYKSMFSIRERPETDDFAIKKISGCEEKSFAKCIKNL